MKAILALEDGSVLTVPVVSEFTVTSCRCACSCNRTARVTVCPALTVCGLDWKVAKPK